MWARAQIAKEIEILLLGSTERILDLQARIKKNDIKIAATERGGQKPNKFKNN